MLTVFLAICGIVEVIIIFEWNVGYFSHENKAQDGKDKKNDSENAIADDGFFEGSLFELSIDE